ncbi:MAG: SPFH domain-containing protein [Candidatus Omnitrophica bacterium]|nr:SPFH domain-containing protein [Candidatus Omnitrophota bacterium]
MNEDQTIPNRERVVTVHNGWIMLVLLICLTLGDIALLVYSIAAGVEAVGHPLVSLFVLSLLLLPVIIVLWTGLFSLQPNEARVLLLFGEYRGTVRESGFHWGNPFYSNGPRQGSFLAQMAEAQAKGAAGKAGGAPMPSRKTLGRNRISLRARTLNGDRLKVNDKRGNPIEIAAVVVWRVEDTAQAVFDVDDFEKYVEMQSESALRHLASQYAYDHGEENEITLRSNVEEVSAALQKELQERLARAGVEVVEARLTHLAYAPEIAQAMLRRQQAEAVIAARQKIVHGAVSMVDMALKELAEKQVVTLDDERRAAMVSNLMVVLCGESEVHPVVNTGTLYT